MMSGRAITFDLEMVLSAFGNKTLHHNRSYLGAFLYR